MLEDGPDVGGAGPTPVCGWAFGDKRWGAEDETDRPGTARRESVAVKRQPGVLVSR
jgi:hypothetical protein